MDKPGISRLRPSTTLEVLDRAFRVYRDNFGLIIALVTVAMVPLTALSLFNTLYVVPRLQPTPNYDATRYEQFLFASIGLTGLQLFISGLAHGLLINAPLTYIASERLLGRGVTIGRAYVAVSGRLFGLALGLIVYYIIMGSLIGTLTVLTVRCAVGIFLIGSIAYVGVNFYAFLVPVFVLERAGLGRSITRAWSLAKSRFWPLLGLTVAALITSGILSVALFATQRVFAGGTIGGASTRTGTVIEVILSAAISIFIVPILPLAYTMMYYDTRTRREGLDIALTSIPIADPRPGDIGSPPPGPFMAPQDWRTLVITLALGFGALIFLVCLGVGFVGMMIPSY